MKKILLIILTFISFQVDAQTWGNFNAFGLQRKIVSGDTTWRFVGSGSNGFRLFNPNGGSTIAGYGLLGSGTIYADSTVLRSWSNSLGLAQLQTRFNLKQNLVTLTTTGTGVATFDQNTGALNIPTASGGSPSKFGDTTLTGISGSMVIDIGATMANTNYTVFISVKSQSSAGFLGVSNVVNTSTTQFTLSWFNASCSGGCPVVNWLVLPSDWNGSGGGGGGGGSYTLPVATASILGGVKQGSGVTIDGTGVISATSTLPDTTFYRTVANSLTKAQTQTALNTKQGTITLTTTGGSGAATLIGNTLNIPIYTGGGGGSVTQVTSANTDISVANQTTTPVLTLNSGTGNNQIVKRTGTGAIPMGSVSGTELRAITSGQDIGYYAGTSGQGAHYFYTNNGSTTAMSLSTSGVLTVLNGMSLGNTLVGGAGATFVGSVSVADEAYDATTWNGSLTVPTKNAIRDKIETLGGGVWTRTSTTLSPTTANDIINVTSNASTSPITAVSTYTGGIAAISGNSSDAYAGKFTNNSSTYQAVDFRNNGSGFLGTFSNSGGVKASVLNNGEIRSDGNIASFGIRLPYVEVSSTYSASATDYAILGTGTFTITLPTPSGTSLGRIYVIKNMGSGTLTINVNGGYNIDGATTATIPMQYSSITVQETRTGIGYIIL